VAIIFLSELVTLPLQIRSDAPQALTASRRMIIISSHNGWMGKRRQVYFCRSSLGALPVQRPNARVKAARVGVAKQEVDLGNALLTFCRRERREQR